MAGVDVSEEHTLTRTETKVALEHTHLLQVARGRQLKGEERTLPLMSIMIDSSNWRERSTSVCRLRLDSSDTPIKDRGGGEERQQKEDRGGATSLASGGYRYRSL